MAEGSGEDVDIASSAPLATGLLGDNWVRCQPVFPQAVVWPEPCLLMRQRMSNRPIGHLSQWCLRRVCLETCSKNEGTFGQRLCTVAVLVLILQNKLECFNDTWFSNIFVPYLQNRCEMKRHLTILRNSAGAKANRGV